MVKHALNGSRTRGAVVGTPRASMAQPAAGRGSVLTDSAPLSPLHATCPQLLEFVLVSYCC